MKKLLTLILAIVLASCTCRVNGPKPIDLTTFDVPINCNYTYSTDLNISSGTLYYYKKAFTSHDKKSIKCITLRAIDHYNKTCKLLGTDRPETISFYSEEASTLFTFLITSNMVRQDTILPMAGGEGDFYSLLVKIFYLNPTAFAAVLAADGDINVYPSMIGEATLTAGQFERALDSMIYGTPF